jgi:sarcosine oxidase
MTETFDAIVLGVGGFGSSALYHLAARGRRVLGIERFSVPTDRGSSHGESRIIRKAYIEHPDYVPLVTAAYKMWRELEAEANCALLHRTGLMLAGPAEGAAVTGTRLAAAEHRLPIDEIPLAEARRRFPGFTLADDWTVMFDPEAGYLEVENCVRSHAECARARGADIRVGETVKQWTSDSRRVRVFTDRGEYEAAGLVVTAGAWAGRMLADLAIPLTVVRKPVFWHPVGTRNYDLQNGAPTFYYETPAGHFYGFPSIDGETLKVAEHTGGVPVDDPLALDRGIHPSDAVPVEEFVARHLPGANPRAARHSVCMYTLTPDHHFVVDVHPDFENVVLGAGFSGHGFKFTTVLGAALADLAERGRTSHPIGFLSLGRDALRRDDR